MKKHLPTLITSLFFLLFDIITKSIVDSRILEGEGIEVIGKNLQIIKIYNRGGVFGIAQGHQLFFTVLSTIVLILLILFYYFEKEKALLFKLAMGMIFAGALGNILDRLMQKPGVVDFIYTGIYPDLMWPAFNIADTAIVSGAFLLGICFFMQEYRSKNKPPENFQD